MQAQLLGAPSPGRNVGQMGNAGEGFLKWARRLLATALTQFQNAINNGF